MGKSVMRLALYFTRPGQVEVREEPVPVPEAGQVLVKTMLSAVSPGTELLVYRQEIVKDIPVDETIPTLSGTFNFPMKYGYSAIGKVIETGADVSPSWKDKIVFAFNPHESYFTASPDELLTVPDNVLLDDAVLLPAMETALNLVMDGHPTIGERVAVFGQGLIGLLTTSLLAQFPLSQLVTVDRYEVRRHFSRQVGAHLSFDCDADDFITQLKSTLNVSGLQPGADLVYELSGNPDVLNQALAVTGFAGRVVLGSWYGQKQAKLDLGSSFHRSRIRLIASQVSTLSPDLSGRWDKARRFHEAWRMLDKIKPSQFITRRFHITEAPGAYRLLEENPDKVVGVVFTY